LHPLIVLGTERVLVVLSGALKTKALIIIIELGFGFGFGLSPTAHREAETAKAHRG